jgi:hypothetical protein
MGLVLTSAFTPAAELLKYTFGVAGQESTVETAPAFAATISAPNITATPVRDVNGQVAIEISSAATIPLDAPFLRVDPQGGSTNAAQAVTAGKYFEFTVTPNANFALNLESLSYSVTRGGASTPRGYALRSSVDNFGANLATADLLTSRPTYTPVALTFDSTFSGQASPVTFRFYVYAPAAGNSIDFDNIVLNGTVTTVPEPGTVSLLAAGAIGLVAAARRRRK